MRKLLSLLFICLAVFANARQITPDEAAAIAADFLNSSGSVQKAGMRVDVRRAQSKKNASRSIEENQPYYVFNATDDKGFVIISGDDRAKKILGYSDRGSFDCDNMPPQLVAILDQYAKQIESLPGSAATDPSWSKPSLAATDGEGVLLETANWGQGYPYNAQCPIIDGVQTPTGCVATAMAIVMKYHNWPESYDWDTMPNVQLESPVESVSKLMADAGDAVLMNYTPCESGAQMNWVGHRLQQTFKYSPECQYITRDNFSDEEWVNMLRCNLDSNEPVIYNGSGTGNHAFIIDGYENDTYHINWGWDGMCNGYFYLDALTPNVSQDFSYNCGMVINITPDRSGNVYSNVFCDRGYFWATGGMCPGAHFSVDSPARNQTFDYTCHVLSYPCDESGQIGLLLYDKDGNVKEVLKSRVFTESRDDFGAGIWGNDITLGQITINSETLPDDYITLATRKSLSHPWVEVLSTIEAPIKWDIADIKKDVSVITIINNIPDSHVSYLNLNTEWVQLENNTVECVKGCKFDLRVTDESGYSCDNISIKIEGTGLYGNTEMFYNSLVAISLYSDIYTITIDEDVSEIEKTVELAGAGTLSEALKDIQLSNIDKLTVTGDINAKDIWFIRENLKTLKALDISDCRIMACEAIDPVEAFRIASSEHLENTLPTYALTGLAKLSSLKLPEGLFYIESNSLMSLAIEQIEIPATVQGIGLNVFFDCERLNTVISRMPQPPAINDCIFTNTMCPASGVLYVPDGSAEIYRGIEVWQDFAQIIEGDGPSTNDEILYKGLKYRVHGEALYLIGYEQSQLPENVNIPDKILINDTEYKVLGIDDNAMQYADMKSFVMSNSITTIGSFLFRGSTVVKVIMSDNIKFLPFNCIDGDYIEELHLPENAEYICNSIYCPSLIKLHLPKSLHSEVGYNGSIGMGFRNLEEITVDPENEEWSVRDGILYWKGLTHLILVPNTFTGKLIIQDETTDINGIEYCDNITEVILGKGIKSLGYRGISDCNKLKHIEFNNNIIVSSNCVINSLPCLESFTMRDFVWSYDKGFCNLPSLKHVYLLNENHVNFGNSFYENVNADHDYFASSLNPQATVPDGCKIYVPGGIKASRSVSSELTEMWKYEIDKTNGRVKIEPLIEGIVINNVVINGNHNEGRATDIYEYDKESGIDLDVVVEFTLHERQQMTTHYDAEFNAAIPSTDLTLVNGIVLNSEDISLFIGNTVQLTVNVLPENAANKTLVWASSDENIATVNNDGMVTAVGVGEAIITATANDGSDVSATCMVRVIPTLAESLTIDPESWAGVEGETFQITAEVQPENTTDKTLNWSSSDETIATVNATGLVSVLMTGSCRITATTTDGSNLTAECKLDVLSGIEEIFSDGATTVDVYNTQGVLIKKNCTKQELNQFSSGIYIICGATEAIRIFIK